MFRNLTKQVKSCTYFTSMKGCYSSLNLTNSTIESPVQHTAETVQVLQNCAKEKGNTLEQSENPFLEHPKYIHNKIQTSTRTPSGILLTTQVQLVEFENHHLTNVPLLAHSLNYTVHF